MLKTNVLFFNISSEFIQTFVLSVSKCLNARCKEQCWLLSMPLKNDSLYLGIWYKFLPIKYFLTLSVYCSLCKHLSPYAGYISEWIWFAWSHFGDKNTITACCSSVVMGEF